jgi:hypothetical protein
MKRAKRASGLPRSEVFAMRLDPRIKYLAEIASRQQRRSLAAFAEDAIESLLERTSLTGRKGISLMDDASVFWDIDPFTRFLQLSMLCPDLLTYPEQAIAKALGPDFGPPVPDTCIRAIWSRLADASGQGDTPEELRKLIDEESTP